MQAHHARLRSLERYGLELTKQVHSELVKMIRDGWAVQVEKQSNRVSIYQTEYRGHSLRFVYDHMRKQIVTFLPNDRENQKGESTCP